MAIRLGSSMAKQLGAFSVLDLPIGGSKSHLNCWLDFCLSEPEFKFYGLTGTFVNSLSVAPCQIQCRIDVIYLHYNLK